MLHPLDTPAEKNYIINYRTNYITNYRFYYIILHGKFLLFLSDLASYHD
jgi:hypothetical protein